LTRRFGYRRPARSLLAVLPLGAGAGAMLGLALGGAFLAGGMARDAAVHARVSNVAQTLQYGLTDASIQTLFADDPGARTLAVRFDPAQPYSGGTMSRQERLLAARLDARLAEDPNLLEALAKPKVNNPAARPWAASPTDTARQLDCLSEAVYYEARGETPAGQAAVAQVVLNRVRHSAFPNSICAVVYQGMESGRCQFSFACNGAMQAVRRQSVWERSRRVAENALGGYVVAEVGTATHFHVTGLQPGWRNMVQVGTIGAHVFYRFGGRNGAPNAFDETPQSDSELILASTAETFEADETEGALTPAASNVDTAETAPAVAPRAAAPAASGAPAPAGEPQVKTPAAAGPKPIVTPAAMQPRALAPSV
jgi:spore germination cell wall hydrolase CwlJ-like protein